MKWKIPAAGPVIKFFSFISFYLLLFSSAHAQSDFRSYSYWSHPVIKALERHDPSVVGIPRPTGNLVNLCIADTSANIAYFVTQFGFIFDTLHLTDERKKEIRIAGKKADPFHWFEASVNQYLPLLLDAKDFLRENGNNFKKASYAQQRVLTLPSVKKASSTLAKLLAIEEFERESKGIIIHFNWWIDQSKDTAVLNRLGEGKPGSLVVHGSLDSGYSVFINKELLSETRKARLEHATGEIWFYDWKNHAIDSFFINKGKIDILIKEKTDVFALYRAWLEWNLQQVNASIPGWQYAANYELLKGKNSYLYTGFSNDRNSKASLTRLQEEKKTLLNKLDRLTGPDGALFSTLIAHPRYEPYQTNTRKWNSRMESWIETKYFIRGHKRFELTDHRGNVVATVSDRKTGIDINGDRVIDAYEADITTATDYYPFGSLMPERKYNKDQNYRYGYNGKENDNEIKGEGNQQDYGMRIYDPRVGRFLSVDPITRKYPELTPYQFASNRPIDGIDIDGLEVGLVRLIWYKQALAKAKEEQIKAQQFKEFCKANNINLENLPLAPEPTETISKAGPKSAGTKWKESDNFFAKTSYSIVNGFYTTGQQLLSSVTGQEQIRNIGGTYYDAKGPLGENERVGNFVIASTTLVPGASAEGTGSKALGTALESGAANRILTTIEVEVTEQVVKKANLVKIGTIEDDVMMFSAKIGDETVEGITNFTVKDGKLYLDKLHLQGSSAGKIGREKLWEMAKDLGRQYNVKEVIIQGGTRTTGKYKGKVPSPVTIKVD